MYDDLHFSVKSEDYQNVINTAKEYVVMVGEIGYYYPAQVWLAESGKIYCTHDYECDVLKFDTIMQLMLYELKGKNIESVVIHYRNVKNW